jgi:hypothetical protein
MQGKLEYLCDPTNQLNSQAFVAKARAKAARKARQPKPIRPARKRQPGKGRVRATTDG